MTVKRHHHTQAVCAVATQLAIRLHAICGGSAHTNCATSKAARSASLRADFCTLKNRQCALVSETRLSRSRRRLPDARAGPAARACRRISISARAGPPVVAVRERRSLTLRAALLTLPRQLMRRPGKTSPAPVTRQPGMDARCQRLPRQRPAFSDLLIRLPMRTAESRSQVRRRSDRVNVTDGSPIRTARRRRGGRRGTARPESRRAARSPCWRCSRCHSRSGQGRTRRA